MNALVIHSLPEAFRQEPRGWTFFPFQEAPLTETIDIDWNSFHTVSLEPGTIRGNHVHPRVTEWLFFCGGPFLLVWQDPGSAVVQQKRIEDHHSYLVIPPGVKHAVQHIGPDPLYLVAFRSRVTSSPEPETVTAKLL